MTEHSPLLGRCKECDFALFATRDKVTDADSFKEVKLVGHPYRVGNNGHFARCPNRHKVFVLKAIKGTYSKDHKCDSRCLNAKGHNCTCSCGGANHGRGYAVEVAEAGTVSQEKRATEKQLAFIERLIAERVMTDEQRKNALNLSSGLTTKKASAWIERLLELPKESK